MLTPVIVGLTRLYFTKIRITTDPSNQVSWKPIWFSENTGEVNFKANDDAIL